MTQLLPIEPPGGFGRRYADFLFEPDPAQVLGLLLPRFVEVEIYHALLEARASEHSARMVAMHNATQNANEVVQELTLSYNKARQAAITTEMLEIASGAGALQGTWRGFCRWLSSHTARTERAAATAPSGRSCRSSGRSWTSSSRRTSYRASSTRSRSGRTGRASSWRSSSTSAITGSAASPWTRRMA